MIKRERRVINAFIECVKAGEFTYDYACLLIEDSQRYGYLSAEAKEEFYAECGNEPPEEDLVAENEAMRESLAMFGVTENTHVTEVADNV